MAGISKRQSLALGAAALGEAMLAPRAAWATVSDAADGLDLSKAGPDEE